MSEDSIKSIIMRRDGLTNDEADDAITEAVIDAQDRLDGGDTLDAIENVIEEHFGLEPDYVMEIVERLTGDVVIA
jgi:hypothetical protein